MVKGYAPEQALQVRAKISVSENGKRYLLATNGKEESVVYAVDGVIVKEGLRCDKLVLVKRLNLFLLTNRILRWRKQSKSFARIIIVISVA